MANAHTGFRKVSWETRNLSRASFEIDYVEEGHGFSEAMRGIEDNKLPLFAQLRVPATDIVAIRCAEGLGFRYAEMSVDPWIRFNRAALYQEFLADRKYFIPSHIDPVTLKAECISVANLSAELRAAVIKISTTVFKDDRFHMDPDCSPALADSRIAQWVEKDLFSPVSENFCSLVYDGDELVGYILWKGQRFILGGIAADYIGKGMAKYLYLVSMEHVAAAGAEELSTTISVNNLEVHNLYSRLGYSFRKPVITLHYWRD